MSRMPYINPEHKNAHQPVPAQRKMWKKIEKRETRPDNLEVLFESVAFWECPPYDYRTLEI